MKKAILTVYLLLFAVQILHGQERGSLPEVYINEKVTTFFILSEPITMADISTDKVVADQPVSNVLRIKPGGKEPLPRKGDFQGVVTIIAQKYLVQYALVYASAEKADKRISIGSRDGTGLSNPDVLSVPEMKNFCLMALQRKTGRARAKNTAHRITGRVNNIFTVGNYFFMDISFRNHSRVTYHIDQVRFRIEDKRKTKRTNFQQTEIKEAYALYKRKTFRKKYRNIYVFEKFTFPNKKVFTLELTEEQVSGRTLTLQIGYSDILRADTF